VVRGKKDIYVGVDGGGTKIVGLLVNEQGEVQQRCRQHTSAKAPLADQVTATIDTLLQQAGVTLEEVQGIGVAIAAVVDSRAGTVVKAPNLAVDDPHLVERLRERYPVPVVIGNDVNCGMLAEVWLGAGRGVEELRRGLRRHRHRRGRGRGSPAAQRP